MASRPRKERIAGQVKSYPNWHELVAHTVGLMLTMPGIPSIYYGTEQALDGSENYHQYSIEPKHTYIDRYIRESMFGGPFAAYGTSGCHFFNPKHPTYLRIAAIARIRNRSDSIGKALRRGHHYLRETSYCDRPFSIPPAGELVAWSQVLYTTEVLIAFNTNPHQARGALVTVDSALHPIPSTMVFLYKGTWSDEQLQDFNVTEEVSVINVDNRSAVRIELPPSGMVILA
jgi:hypothetical protein